jgi:hypothetical protein
MSMYINFISLLHISMLTRYILENYIQHYEFLPQLEDRLPLLFLWLNNPNYKQFNHVQI